MRQTILGFFVLCFLFVGCEDENAITPEEASAQVESWSVTVEDDINGRASGTAVQKELEAILDASVKSESAKLGEGDLPIAKIAHDVYKAREFKPKLIQRGTLSKTGESVWTEVQRLNDHGLDPKTFHQKEITDGVAELKEAAADAPDESFVPTVEEKAAVTAWLTGKSKIEFPLDETTHEKLTDELLENSDRLSNALDQLNEIGKKVGSKSARLEALLAIDLARLSSEATYTDTRYVFLHKRVDDAHYENGTAKKRTDEEWGSLRGDLVWRIARKTAEKMTNKQEFLERQIREGIAEIFDAEEPKNVVKEHVYARHPQYGKMLDARKKYQAIVDAGGWKEVEPKKKLKKGSSDATVLALKERLKKEGYLPADLKADQKFDDKLETAIKDYQETHQLEVTGEPHKNFWKSLNVDASKRLRQLTINVERLRRTQVRQDDGIFVYINIPDFHAEVWEEQERKMRFRVVVGNNDRVKDEKTQEWSRANRTPVPMAAMIDRVIYNPYWVVTPRVRTNEILRDVRKDLQAKYAAQKEKAIAEGKDPSTLEFTYLNKETGEVDASTTIKGKVPGWYAAHGYEVVGAGSSFEYVRMIPGKNNALGQVKVIFPNLHDVYLHDTNARALFKNPVRAYSHGCMRMQNPLDFAEYLLRRDKLFEANNVPELLKKRSPSPIFLNRKVPVFIEYYTARVDDQERVHFLADPYDYDDKPLEALLTAGKPD